MNRFICITLVLFTVFLLSSCSVIKGEEMTVFSTVSNAEKVTKEKKLEPTAKKLEVF